MRGFLPQDGVNEFVARMVCKEVQKLVFQFEGVAGLRSIFQDKASLLMEITSWQATNQVQALCDDIVALSPKWALVRTGIRTAQWEEVLSGLMRSNPYECILRIQWRPSYHGGRPWAQPAATMQQIQAVRTQARLKLSTKGANGEDLQGAISL